MIVVPHPINAWTSQDMTLPYKIDHKALQQQWGRPALSPVPAYRKLPKRTQTNIEARGRKRSDADKNVEFTLGTKSLTHDNALGLASSKEWTTDSVIVNVKEARSQSTSSSETNSPTENHCGAICRVSDYIDTLPLTPPSPATSTRSFASSGRHVSVGFYTPETRKHAPAFKGYQALSPTLTNPLPTPPLSGAFDFGKISSARRLFAIEEDEVPVLSRNRSKGILRELLSEKRRESFYGQTIFSAARQYSVTRVPQTKLRPTSLADSPISPPILEDEELLVQSTSPTVRGHPLPARVMEDTSSHASLKNPRYISYITMIRLPSFSAFVRGFEEPSAPAPMVAFDGVSTSDTHTSVQLSPTSAFPSSVDQFSPPPRRRSDGDLLRKRVLEWNMVLNGKTNGIRLRGEKEPVQRNSCSLSGRERWMATLEAGLLALDDEVEEEEIIGDEGIVQAEAIFAKHQLGSIR